MAGLRLQSFGGAVLVDAVEVAGTDVGEGNGAVQMVTSKACWTAKGRLISSKRRMCRRSSKRWRSTRRGFMFDDLRSTVIAESRLLSFCNARTFPFNNLLPSAMKMVSLNHIREV